MKLHLSASIKKASLTTFEELMAYQIAGNFHYDSAFFEAAESFIRNTSNPVEQRAQIVRRYDEAMGEEVDGISMTDQQLVDQFISDMEEGNVNVNEQW